MQLIQTGTVGAGGAANITFTGIPQTFTDLLILASCRSTFSGDVADMIYVNFNSAGTSNYANQQLANSGSFVFAFTGTEQVIGFTAAALSPASTFAVSSAYIPNYVVSTNKAVTIDAVSPSTTNSFGRMVGMRWTNTAAISSMVITPQAGNFVEFSTISLYGILRGSGGATVS